MGRQAAPCLRCAQIVEISEAALVADIRLRTVGLEEAVRSPQASVYICVTCTDLMAKGDEPNGRTRPLDHLVYELVQDFVTGDPSFTFLSWVALRKLRGLPTPSFSEPKVLKAWNELRRVTALPATVEREDAQILPPEKRLREAS
jgi:hypothetical protein